MDRSRRSTNPTNYNENGAIKRGTKTWFQSNRYKKRQQKKANTERKLARSRKAAHGNLCNRILGQGNIIKTEKISYKNWQKNYGRSIKIRAPGLFISMIHRKAERAGGQFIEINTQKTRLSQFDHIYR